MLSTYFQINKLYLQIIDYSSHWMSKLAQIQGMINMQHLLNQYQRENQSLNQQVLDLLAQNKALKIHKINSQSLHKSLANSRKSNSRGKTLTQQDENVIDKMWKLKKEEKQEAKKKNIQKKDTAVQVEPIPELLQNKLESLNMTSGHKSLASDLYSFGSASKRDQFDTRQKERREEELSPPRYTEGRQQKSKEKSTGIKETERQSVPKTPIHIIQEANRSSLEIHEHKEQQYSQLSPTKKIKSRIEEGSDRSCRRRGKSTHSILPSPKLQPTSSQIRIASPSQQKTFLSRISRQNSHLRLPSNAKRKSFIQVVTASNNYIKPIFMKKGLKPDGC